MRTQLLNSHLPEAFEVNPIGLPDGLRKGSGSHFDPDIGRTLVDLVGMYPTGSMLRLSDGRVALVTRKGESDLPETVLVADTSGQLLEMPEPVVLERETVVEQVMADAVGFDPSSEIRKSRARASPLRMRSSSLSRAVPPMLNDDPPHGGPNASISLEPALVQSISLRRCL